MTPLEFIKKWGDSKLARTPGLGTSTSSISAPPGRAHARRGRSARGNAYCFERGAEKVGGGDGWAELSGRDRCFGWEYKGKHKDLNAAPPPAPGVCPSTCANPPLSGRFRHGADHRPHQTGRTRFRANSSFTLADLLEPANLELLRQRVRGSEELRPGPQSAGTYPQGRPSNSANSAGGFNSANTILARWRIFLNRLVFWHVLLRTRGCSQRNCLRA